MMQYSNVLEATNFDKPRQRQRRVSAGGSRTGTSDSDVRLSTVTQLETRRPGTSTLYSIMFDRQASPPSRQI